MNNVIDWMVAIVTLIVGIVLMVLLVGILFMYVLVAIGVATMNESVFTMPL